MLGIQVEKEGAQEIGSFKSRCQVNETVPDNGESS